jgi:hypothetical protein
LVEVEEERGVLTVRRTVEARRRDVLYVRADTLGRLESSAEADDDPPPSMPPSSEGDDQTGLDDDRDVVGDLARSLDYPIVELSSKRWVLPGSRSWGTFIAVAGATALRDARQRLERLAQRSTGGAGRW